LEAPEPAGDSENPINLCGLRRGQDWHARESPRVAPASCRHWNESGQSVAARRSPGTRAKEALMGSFQTALMAAVVLGLVPGEAIARSGVVPPPAGSQSIVRPKVSSEPSVVVEVVEDSIRMNDGETGAPILVPRALKISYDYRGLSLKPQIQTLVKNDGFDLVYRFENTSEEPKPLGAMGIGFFTLGPKVTYLEPAGSMHESTAEMDKFESASFVYPTRAYSPVMVLRNDRYAVGVSVMYPVEDYRHDVRVSLVNADEPASEELPGGRGWAVDVRLSNCGDEQGDGVLAYSGMIEPGESREYTIAVRVTKRPDQWVRTLLPYREYFESLYGGHAHQRDPRPVMPWSVSEAASQNDQNPHGYFGPVQWRPDLFGWQQIIKSINLNSASFGRVMLMAPSGLYQRHAELNPPFQMATPWKNNPQLIQALDPARGLRGITKGKRQLGLWWGNAIRVSGEWDSGDAEVLDLDNHEHRRLAYAEIETAIQAGVTMIVLGNSSAELMPAWEIAEWVHHLNHRYPGVKFVTSPLTCDLMHVVSPGVVQGWDEKATPQSSNEILSIRGPHSLADFLFPGHETWASFQYARHRTEFKVQPTVNTVIKDMRTVAEHGYVPFFLELGGDGKQIKAAPSWERTVPSDLLPQALSNDESSRRGLTARRVDVRVAGDGQTIISDGIGEITRISKPLIVPGKPGATKARKPRPPTNRSSGRSIGSVTNTR
jgi:hypothetical protein